jgi:hypothetical protein
MKKYIPLILALIFLTGCDGAGPGQDPKPDLKLQYNRGSVSATLIGRCENCVLQWEENIGASAEVQGAEVGGERYEYEANVSFHYRIIRDPDIGEADTTAQVARIEKVRSGNGLVYAGVEEITDASGEYTMPDSVVFEVSMKKFDQTKRVVSTQFEDSRGGDGSLQ